MDNVKMNSEIVFAEKAIMPDEGVEKDNRRHSRKSKGVLETKISAIEFDIRRLSVDELSDGANIEMMTTAQAEIVQKSKSKGIHTSSSASEYSKHKSGRDDGNDWQLSSGHGHRSRRVRGSRDLNEKRNHSAECSARSTESRTSTVLGLGDDKRNEKRHSDITGDDSDFKTPTAISLSSSRSGHRKSHDRSTSKHRRHCDKRDEKRHRAITGEDSDFKTPTAISLSSSRSGHRKSSNRSTSKHRRHSSESSTSRSGHTSRNKSRDRKSGGDNVRDAISRVITDPQCSVGPSTDHNTTTTSSASESQKNVSRHGDSCTVDVKCPTTRWNDLDNSNPISGNLSEHGGRSKQGAHDDGYKEFLVRHVNQLFIRGDNVVLVAIFD